MKTFLKFIVAIALVVVAAFYLTFVLIVLACIIGLGFLLICYWIVSGVPFYSKKNGKIVAEYRRLRRVK